MKRDFTPENFEDFLKRSTDDLRMRAPDKVWQNLSKELNGRRRRFLIGLSAFLFLTSATGYYIIANSSHDKNSTAQQSSQQATSATELVNEKAANNPKSVATNGAIVVAMQPEHRQTNNASATPVNAAKLVAMPILNHGQESPEPGAGATSQSELKNEFSPSVIDSYPEADAQPASSSNQAKQVIKGADENFPLTIESVVNSYKANRKHFETQLYFSPTISYRKLTENKSYLRGLDPAAIPAGYPALHSSVNSYVTHKPAIGFELGFATKYLLSNSVKLRGGLQFNVNRYDVKAFSSSGSIATIALNNGTRIDSLNTYSTYSNLSGYKSDWLQNLSFQLSAPIGVEYLFKGTDKMRFGFATTVQPTYILGDRAYLITTDYKRYTEVPWLIRRWNVNTAFETFVTLQGPKTKWQIGPQVRYQLLSSFVSRYPVKENLFDFGLKVGISLNK
jgi:hypothetical protein